MPSPQDPESLAKWVKEQWDKGDRALLPLRKDYWLNRAFFSGSQWVWWHTGSSQVIEYPRSDDRVRNTRNKIQPNVITLLSRLLKRDLMFEVEASGTDDAALEGARLGDHLLEHYRFTQGWEAVRYDEVFGAIMGANSAVLVEWDGQAGEMLGYDEQGAEVFGGEPQLTAFSVSEFTVQPGSRTWRDSPFFLAAKVLPTAFVKQKYRLDREPQADGRMANSPIHLKLLGERQDSDVPLCVVYTYYERPDPAAGYEGRHVVVVGNDVLVDRPWPYPYERLPIYVFRCIQYPQQWTGHTFVTDARPVQVALNHAVSVVSEHLKQASNARLFVADNASIDLDEFTDEAGEFVKFDGTAVGNPAFYLSPPQLPRWITDQIVMWENALDDLLFVHDISRGQAPGDRNSGLALSVLAEKDETPLGIMAHDQAQGWAEIGTMVLELLQANVVEFREAAVRSDAGIPLVREWTGRHLNGQTKARVPLDAVMPYTKASVQAWVLSISERFPQLMPANLTDLARLLDLPEVGKFAEMADADAHEAQRENHVMSMGMVPALGDRPLPATWQNHPAHIAEHNRFRKSRAYYYADPMVRQIVDAHIQAHEILAFEDFLRQQGLEGALPGASLVPQANEPLGSAVPPDFAERQMAMQMQSGGLGANAPITGSATGPGEMTGEPDDEPDDEESSDS